MRATLSAHARRFVLRGGSRLIRKALHARHVWLLEHISPTQCGLATFNAALASHLTGGAPGSGVVRLLSADATGGGLEVDRTAPRIVHTWHTDTSGGWAAAANALNRFDVAVLQHEYGIYPGDGGDEVLPLLRALKVPTIVVLHTVLSNPSPLQRTVLERIVAAADAVVTMTDTARRRLTTGYRVDPEKITVIPHGAGSHSGTPRAASATPHLLTWGAARSGQGHRMGAARGGPAR
nr:hypothetical protein GCM10020092_024840 [Actinoplanes digitatis]